MKKVNTFILKNSFRIRRIYDLLINLDNFLILQVENYCDINFLELRKKLKNLGFQICILNKDMFFSKFFNLFGKGPTLIFYKKIDNFFYMELLTFFEQSKISVEFLLVKKDGIFFYKKTFDRLFFYKKKTILFFRDLLKFDLLSVKFFSFFLVFFYFFFRMILNFYNYFLMILLSLRVKLVKYIVNFRSMKFFFIKN